MSIHARFFVGTYTQTIVHGTGERVEGMGDGIYGVELNANGVMTGRSLLAQAENPSYLCVSADGRFLYAVHELKRYEGSPQGAVSAYAIGEDGQSLTLLNQRATGGTDPCHVAVSRDGRSVTVCNYMSGSVCGFPVEKDGGLGEGQLIQHQGRGRDPLRQAGPHAHAATYSECGRFVYVTDLGLDKIIIYALHPEALTLQEIAVCVTPPGAGPRYCEKHPHLDRLLCINELDCSVASYEIGSNGLLHPLSSVSMVTAVAPPSIAAGLAIAPNGRYVYGSLQGANRIACIEMDRAGGLRLVAAYPSGGAKPRDLTLSPDGRHLIVANQDSNNLVTFSIDPDTGVLTETCRYHMPTPVWVGAY